MPKFKTDRLVCQEKTSSHTLRGRTVNAQTTQTKRESELCSRGVGRGLYTGLSRPRPFSLSWSVVQQKNGSIKS
ncbi:hypothetical protein UPYG_G00152790 [Umbra pygmaea]|uniref:Uncharacterized protein n=1 Tax=Umbra pygmaea TaxID=75934 RepID=A0ABD0WXD8_UMBPY